MWFAPVGSLDERWALRICASCPVAEECWTEAKEVQELGGIRGGRRLPSGFTGWAVLSRCARCGREFPGAKRIYCNTYCLIMARGRSA
jgi:hypothetical protein